MPACFDRIPHSSLKLSLTPEGLVRGLKGIGCAVRCEAVAKPGRLELIKERRGYVPANQGHSPTQAALTEGQSPSSDQTAQPKPRSSIWLRPFRSGPVPAWSTGLASLAGKYFQNSLPNRGPLRGFDFQLLIDLASTLNARE
jgi:hypothetical protein